MGRTQIGYSSLRQPFIYYCFNCIRRPSLKDTLRKVCRERGLNPNCAKCGEDLNYVANFHYLAGIYPAPLQDEQNRSAMMGRNQDLEGAKPVQRRRSDEHFGLQGA